MLQKRYNTEEMKMQVGAARFRTARMAPLPIGISFPPPTHPTPPPGHELLSPGDLELGQEVRGHGEALEG